MRRLGIVQLGLVGLVVLPSCRSAPRGSNACPGQPISMAELHRTGGVPPGWRFLMPVASGSPVRGRQVFIDYGCPSCHSVQSEQFPATSAARGPGPDLSGMGSHHPAEYFAESIVNPDAVLVDGPGYIGPDGHSMMPTYGDMTLAQLGDVVAYLQSLRSGVESHAHWQTASSYYLQIDAVSGEQFDAFDDWFANGGARQLKGVNGLVTLDTYVARTPNGRLVARIFGFEDDAVLNDFVTEMQSTARPAELGNLPPVGSAPLFHSPPIYKAIGLAIP